MRTEELSIKETGKILIFSDLHAHEYKPFSRPTSEGYSTRLQKVVDVLKTIYSYAEKNKIEHVFFLGDLFHHRTYMYNIVLTQIANVIDSATENSITSHFILGNHDFIANSDNSPSIVRKLKNIDVIDSPTIYSIKNSERRICCMPFRFSEELLRSEIQELSNKVKKFKESHLLMGHFELSGASISNEYVLNSSVNPDIFDNTVFPYIISGHVHKHQKIKYKDKIIEFVGVPIQHTFNDEGNDYGFIIYDLQNSSIIPSTYIHTKDLGVFPEFITTELHDQDDVKEFSKKYINRLSTDYFRIRGYSDEIKLTSLFKKIDNHIYEYSGPMTASSGDSDGAEQIQFNLDIQYYLEEYKKDNSKTQDLGWLDSIELLKYLDSIMLKGGLS